MVYSGEGLGKMTRTFHDLYRNHLIRSPYLHQKRPILINNWKLHILILMRKSFWILQKKLQSWELRCWLWMMAGLESGAVTIVRWEIGLSTKRR